MKLPRYVDPLAFLLLAVFVFACLVNKAQYSSLTTGESASYLVHVPGSVGDILTVIDSDPDNQPLNSLPLSDDYVYAFDSLWSTPDTTFVAVERFLQAKPTLWRRQLVAVP